MRKGISKAERRKALRVADKHAGLLDSGLGCLATIPEFLACGAYNAVYALSADLVLRIQRSAYEYDSSWDFYEVAQLYPHPALPTVWELGEFKEYKFAIVERMDCTLNALKARGQPVSRAEASANAVEHLMAVSGKEVCDTHEYNIMKRRKKDEFVLVDCFLEYGDCDVANQ